MQAGGLGSRPCDPCHPTVVLSQHEHRPLLPHRGLPWAQLEPEAYRPLYPWPDKCRVHVCRGWAAGGKLEDRSVGGPGPTAPLRIQAAPALSPAPRAAEADSPWPR